MQQHTTTEACLEQALALVTKPGLALEFGVCNGRTLRTIVDGMPAGSQVVGFDSFDGLPEDWRDGFPAGTFRTTPPEVPGAELVIGLYADTLPGWADENRGAALRLVHIDCDLYSSTRDVLEHLTPYLTPGCLIVFDEFHGYPGAEAHEAKAWDEWTKKHGVSWTELAFGPEQLLIRLEKS